MSVAVILPTYCEAGNIESLIRDIEELELDLRIVVIDDSSPDGTAEIVKKIKEEFGNIHLISRPKKFGLGTAITTGFRHMLKLRRTPDYIVTMDADYSHNPRDIPKLVNAAKYRSDLVIGSRYQKSGKVVGSPLSRRIISRVANVLAATTVGARIRDCTSGFRCYSGRYVKSVLDNLHSETYEIQIETLRQARLNGFRIEETPITFVDRKLGKSKLTRAEFKGFLFYVFKSTLKPSWLIRAVIRR